MNKLLLIFLLMSVNPFLNGQQKIEGVYNPSSRLFDTENSDYHIDFFKNGLARIYQKGYVGLMDSLGQILIPPKYDQISDFQGDVAVVYINKQAGLIHKSGKLLVEPFNGVIEPFVNGYAKCKIDYYDSRIINTNGEFINEHLYGYIGPLKDNRFTFIRDQNFGLLTTEGKEIVVIEGYNDTEYEGLVQYAHFGASMVIDRTDLGNLFELNEGRAITFAKVKGDIKFGFIDKNGKTVIPIKYDQVLPFENGMAAVKLGHSWGVVDKDGATVIPCSHENIKILDKERFIISKDSLYGVINRSGTKVIPIKYESIESIDGRNYIVSQSGQFGVVNEENKKTVKLKYPTLIHLFDDLLITHNGKKWGVITTSDKVFLPFQYDGINKTSNNSGVASVYKSSYSLHTGVPRYVYQGTYREFDRNGINRKNEAKPFSKTIEMVGDNHRKEAVIRRGPYLYTPYILPNSFYKSKNIESEYDFEQKLNGGFKIVGFIDSTSDVGKLRSRFPTTPNPVKYLKGIINARGEVVVPIKYNELRLEWGSRFAYNSENKKLSNNLFIAQLGDLQGVITIDNQMIVPIEYYSVELYPGFIFLMKLSRTEEEYGYVDEYYDSGIADMKGRIIVPLKEYSTPNDVIQEWFDDEERGPQR